MKKICVFFILLFLPALSVQAAYHHGADTDSDIALQAHPEIAGTKLDSCALCHTGGEYEKKPGLFITMGSCQWCHYSYGYDGTGDIAETLNGYGEAYLLEGKNIDAFETISAHDSDGDGFSNQEEIAAGRYPGDVLDDPTKVPAPFKVFSLAELEQLKHHRQLMLMNTHKSGDFYAEYGGVAMEDLLDEVQLLEDAVGILVYAPDGWAQYHPLEEDSDPLMYQIYGVYPEALYYHDPQAEDEEIGWCDYSSPAVQHLEHGDPVFNKYGLKMLLAYSRDGEYLQQGQLDDSNRLDGEGPFRVVPPQKIPGPPDQSVKSDYQDVIWPFDEYADHNAGFATRSATIIKVEPLPEGTTDIDVFEAGWDYVDEGKIIIYGAIDPRETIINKLKELKGYIKTTKKTDYKHKMLKKFLRKYVGFVKRLVKRDLDDSARRLLDKLTLKVDGCVESGAPDKSDWIISCEQQNAVYWSLHELKVLIDIE